MGMVQGQPTPASTMPVYLPDPSEWIPDGYGSSEAWYQNRVGKENMQGFYSNYTNLFYWFGDMGTNRATHGPILHHILGLAVSPDGVNWHIDRHWGLDNGLIDFSISQDGLALAGPGVFDVVLEANGRYFWIVAFDFLHASPYEINARKGELHKDGSITWVHAIVEITDGDEGSTAKATWPLNAEVDTNGRLFVSYNSINVQNDYQGWVRWSNSTDGGFSNSLYAHWDSLLGYSKPDDFQIYLWINRLENGRMAWTGVWVDFNIPHRERSATFYFNNQTWFNNDHELFHTSAGAAETNMEREVDIVSYGDNLVAVVTVSNVTFLEMYSMNATYNHDWGNQTILNTYPAGSGTFVPHLTATWEGNIVLVVYKHGDDLVNYTYRFANYTWNPNFQTLLNGSWGASYDWQRFSFMETTGNFIPFWFEDKNLSYAELAFHYFTWNGTELPIVANFINTTLSSFGGIIGTSIENGTITDDWLFEGEVYELEAFMEGGTGFSVNTGDSRHDIRFNWDNSSEQMWISVDPPDQFTVGLIHSEFERTGNITRMFWRFILDRSIIDSQNNSWSYSLIWNGLPMTSLAGFNTSIYNLGGLTDYTFTGDGGRITGGHPFELYATDGTAGSSARAEQIYRKLQHIHFLIEIDMDQEWNEGNGEFDITPAVGWIDIGIDYRLNGTWVLGSYVRLYIIDADVGHHNAGNDHNWMEWAVDWYNYDPGTGLLQNIRSGSIFTNNWGYDNENLDPDFHNRTSAQIWVDLWFDRTNSSTTIAGQVNAMFHGMREHGSSWWFGYGNFQPMISEYGNAMFLDDLYDEGGNVTDSLKFDLMRVFVEVGKVDIEAGNNETWTIRGIENFNRKQADDRMQGIEQPAFEETLVLNMPMFQSLNPLIRAIDGLSRSIWMGALGFIKILWGAMDTIFEWAGFGAGFFSILSQFVIETIPDLIIVIMNNLTVLVISFVDIIESIFNLLVVVVPTYVIALGWLAESLIDYWRAFSDIFAGGIVDFSIIEDLALGTWISAGITMLPFYEIWTIIWSKDVSGKLKERSEFYSALFGGLLGFFRSMVSMVGELVQAIRSFLPI